MVLFVDARVPVRFGPLAEAGPDSALLIEGDCPAPHGEPCEHFTLPRLFGSHPMGCTCCIPRAPVAQALSRLFLARARGEVAFFRGVTVAASPAGRAAVLAALADDPLVSAWFRVAASTPEG